MNFLWQVYKSDWKLKSYIFEEFYRLTNQKKYNSSVNCEFQKFYFEAWVLLILNSHFRFFIEVFFYFWQLTILLEVSLEIEFS